MKNFQKSAGEKCKFRPSERGLKCFGHVSDRFWILFRVFQTVFRIKLKFFGGSFVLQACRPNVLSCSQRNYVLAFGLRSRWAATEVSRALRARVSRACTRECPRKRGYVRGSVPQSFLGFPRPMPLCRPSKSTYKEIPERVRTEWRP